MSIHPVIQDVGIIAAIAMAAWSLRLALRGDKREDERLDLQREQHENALKARLPDMRIRPGSVSGQGRPNREPVFSVDVQNYGGPEAPEVWLEASFEGVVRRSQEFVRVPSGGGAKPQVTVPDEWAMAGSSTVRAGVAFRAYDAITGVEDTLTIE
jgi:hypothetical protein